MAYITTYDFSLVVGISAVTVPLQFPGLGAIGSPGQFAKFMRITNVAPDLPASANVGSTQPGAIWLSRSGTAAVNGAGSQFLLPGQFQEFRDYIPTNPLSVVAVAANTPLTIEIG